MSADADLESRCTQLARRLHRAAVERGRVMGLHDRSRTARTIRDRDEAGVVEFLALREFVASTRDLERVLGRNDVVLYRDRIIREATAAGIAAWRLLSPHLRAS